MMRFYRMPVIVMEKEITMEVNDALLNEITLLRQTLERIATSLEDIDDTLEILFLDDDYEDEEEMEEMDLLDLDADEEEFRGGDKEVDED